MSLSLALSNALAGLNVNRQSLAVLSQNIANANTRGYSRKIINQQSMYLDGNGVGVSIRDVGRKVDSYLINAIRTQTSTFGKMQTVSDYNDRTQLLLGQPGSQNSVDAFMRNFFNAVQSLGQTPENSTLRVTAVNSAVTFARETRRLASELQQLRFQADQDLGASITAINQQLRELATLNNTISSNKSLGRSVSELEDRRDVILQDLSTYLDIDTYENSNGEVNVSTAGGISLLDQSTYQLSYTPLGSTESFVNDGVLNALQVYRIDDDGNQVGTPVDLIESGTSSGVTTVLTNGRIKGLLELRDRQIPNMLAQLDMLASTMRDQFNEVHNRGIAFPGANSYTGTRPVNAEDFSRWSGQTRIAVLDREGRPIPSPYADETSGFRPLLLDLSKLNTGNDPGNPSVQGIIDEINQYYGRPQNKVVLGDLNNIRLASASSSLPGSSEFTFDFDIENISANDADFFVTGIQVLDDTDTDITSVSENVPQVALDPASTYVTTAGSQTVTVNTTAAHGFAVGDRVYLSNPGVAVDGIPADQLEGFFTITNVTETGFDISVDTAATAGATTGVASQTATPRYAEIEAGDYRRTTDEGQITVDLSGNTSTDYYTVKVNVAAEDEDGNLQTSVLTYRVYNDQDGLLNDRYSVREVTGAGTMVQPSSTDVIARAMLVDADGNELSRTNGIYTTAEDGYLKIIAGDEEYFVAIDSLNSAEEGQPNGSPAIDGTDRGFSYYFELNNFFERYDDNGDSLTNSAYFLDVEQRLIDNANLFSLGGLAQSARPEDESLPPYYTYERNIGDNSIVQELAGLALSAQTFLAAGGLGQSRQTFASYAGSIIGAASTNALVASSDRDNAEILLEGFSQRSASISGVNLDEELANTVIYQNAYSASARVITVASELFDTLLEAF